MQGAREISASTFTVLVADDDWSVRSVLAESLKQEGFQVAVDIPDLLDRVASW